MKFPQNRTEIMDQVAAFAVDNDLSSKEKEPFIRLALMHWNHVPDKSMPEIQYEGFDPDWISPVKQLNLEELIDGAPDYIDQRCEELNQDLKRVSKVLLALESERGRMYGDDESVDAYKHVKKMNELYSMKEGIIESLEKFDYQVIDRKVSFELYDGSKVERVEKIESILKEIINEDTDFQIGVDLRVSDGRDATNFDFFLNKDLVEDLVKVVNTVFDNPDIASDVPDAIIREHHRAVPLFKDMRDLVENERKQREVKKEMKKEESGLSM
jgi:hypothetical protein